MHPSIPQPEGDTVLLHEIPAARAAAWIVPRFHRMLGFHGTGRNEFLPDQTGIFAIAQNYGRNFRAEKAGELGWLAGIIRPAPEFREDIVEFAAIAACDRLHLAMNAAVRPAGKIRAVMTQRTFKVIRPAHGMQMRYPQPRRDASVSSHRCGERNKFFH